MNKLIFFTMLVKERFLANPNLDWGFYLITGVSYIYILGYAHFFYHATVRKFRFGE